MPFPSMATSPSPFFPTTAPAYAPTTSFPPPPFGFGTPASGFSPAPPYGHNTFLSTTVFPPPPSGSGAPAPGFSSASAYGQYNSPFPFFYSVPPAFPYAATYPYSPPASAYMPASGISPNWPPQPTPSDPISTQIDPHQVPAAQPWVASAPSPELDPRAPQNGDLSSTANALPCRPDQAPAAPLLSELSSQTPQLLDTTPSAPNHKRCQRHASTPSSGSPFQQPPTPTSTSRANHSYSKASPLLGATTTTSNLFGTASFAASTPGFSSGTTFGLTDHVQQAAEGRVLRQASAPEQTEQAMPDHLACEIGHIQNQLQQQEYCLQSIQGEVANLSKGVARLGISMQQIQEGNIPSQASDFGMERDVQLSEMPQSYGFDNLNSQSVILADGTERRYFTLPADYPLAQAIPPRSHAVESVDVPAPSSVAAQVGCLAPGLCSKANSTTNFESTLVHNMQAPTTMQDTSSVFTKIPVYDIYEEDNSCLKCMDEQLVKPFHKAENAFSEQLLTCINKAPETEKRIACLNYSSHLFDFTLELQQQDDEMTCNCPVQKASNSLVTRPTQLSIELSMRELRLLWDPGVSPSLHSNKSEPTEGLSYMATVFPKVLDLCNQVGTYEQQLRDSHCNVSVSLEGRKEWDPGDTKLTVLFTIVAGATKWQCTHVYNPKMVHAHAVNFIARGAPIFASGSMCYFAFGVGWTAVLALVVPCSKGKPVAKHSMFLSNGGTRMTNHYFPKVLMQLVCAATAVQVTVQRHPLEFSLMDEREFRYGQLTYMPHNPTINSFEFPRHMFTVLSCWLFSFENQDKLQWDPGIVTPSSIYPLLQGLTARIATGKLSWLQISELPTWQSQLNNASYVWDPGTMLLWYRSIWLLLFTEEEEMGRLITEQWSLRFKVVHYCQIFQKCNGLSFQQYSHQGINLYEHLGRQLGSAPQHHQSRRQGKQGGDSHVEGALHGPEGHALLDRPPG